MKKTYLLTSIFVITLLLSPVAHAEYSTTTTNKIIELKQRVEEARQEVLEEKNSIQSETASGTEGVRQELKDAVVARINKKLDGQKMKIAGVFEDAISNLKDLISRIESRITKMESNNLDVSLSRTLLLTAKTNLTQTEEELTNLEYLLSQNITAVSTSTVKMVVRKNELQKIKVQSEKTKKSIKITHASIVNVVNSLKAGLLKEKNSTSTNN